MIFRKAKPDEFLLLCTEGYKEWAKSRTFEQYCEENGKEDAYGTRHVIEEAGEIVSSLILLDIKSVLGTKTYGIGSVLTPKAHAGKGYASELIKNCISSVYDSNTLIFLFSDISPAFYKRLGFRILPKELQTCPKSTCMVYCEDSTWESLMNYSLEELPDYF